MKKVMGMMAKGGGMPRIPGMRMPGRADDVCKST